MSRMIRRPANYWHFVGWSCLSIGFHIDFVAPNIEIHLPFGFFRFGWQYYLARTDEEIQDIMNKELFKDSK